MKMLALLLSFAVIIGTFGAIAGLTAKPIGSLTELSCTNKYNACFDRCDKAKNTTAKKYPA